MVLECKMKQFRSDLTDSNSHRHTNFVPEVHLKPQINRLFSLKYRKNIQPTLKVVDKMSVLEIM